MFLTEIREIMNLFKNLVNYRLAVLNLFLQKIKQEITFTSNNKLK